jgi:Mat/Ecp fimbriae periplasmic chaperone
MPVARLLPPLCASFRCLAAGTLALLACAFGGVARADISLSQIIVDFQPGQPLVQDIEVQNQGQERAYIEVTVARIDNPGTWPMQRFIPANPAEAGLIATPGKFALGPGSTRLLRLIATEPAGESERIYRVAVVPKSGDIADERTGVKVVIGYEALIIVRPRVMHPTLDVRREGKNLIIRNTGNTNVLAPSLRQCRAPGQDCTSVNGVRIYPGRTETIALPRDESVEVLFNLGPKSWSETYR